MVALDQRESLRTMLAAACRTDPGSVPDDALRRFKSEGIRVLSRRASAILIDRRYGMAGSRPAELAPGCAFVLAADELEQSYGGPVTSTRIDPGVSAALIRSVHADAAKLLVLWSADSDREERSRMVGEFLRMCAEAGTPGIVEGVARRPQLTGDALDEAILAAAAELGAHGPALYKCEVPTLGQGSPGQIERLSRQITGLLPCPWVVLSSGVAPDGFPAAVSAACRGGASGFLAGRGVWTGVVGAADIGAAFAGSARARLDQLIEAAGSAAPARPAP
jgi:sulfofructosephosphate aldolase